ncbi:Di-glucose binding protein with kinesin motor domain, partial [Globisporangium splendens]
MLLLFFFSGASRNETTHEKRRGDDYFGVGSGDFSSVMRSSLTDLRAFMRRNERGNKEIMSSSQQLYGAKKDGILLLVDSPSRDEVRDTGRQFSVTQQQLQPQSMREPGDASEEQETPSLGQLLVDMTAQVQDERAKRSEVEKRNHALMLEIEQLQRDILDLKTSCVSERRRRRGSEELEQAKLEDALAAHDGTAAESWWKELREAKKAKEKALVEAHQRAMQVMELNACISMQHDELKALRTTENEARMARIHAEDQCKELIQQTTILQQENQILKDDVVHLNTEIGKRGVHFKALMEKWTDSQAQSEHFERENHAMLEKMKELRQRSETFAETLEKLQDERDCLQHQVNHLKGAVAAKAAEPRTFQAYGTNARDHLQAQNAVIQRHHVLRRKMHKVARDAVITVKTMKTTLASIRAPIVAIQQDFHAFLRNLQAPVVSLVSRSHALRSVELTRRHLHEQLWKSRRNALLVCQIRNLSAGDNTMSMGTGAAGDEDRGNSRSLRVNYSTGELLMKEQHTTERDTLTVRFDRMFSDRAREWNSFESVMPVVQSVLDGCNACVTTFAGLLPLRTSQEPPPSDTQLVPELVLRELFNTTRLHGAHFHRTKITISYLGVYNECVYDLLELDDTQAAHNNDSAAPSHPIVVLEVQNLEEALLVLRGGQENVESAHARGVLDSDLTHKVTTMCLTYENLLSGLGTTKSKLQIAELAVGSQYTATHETDLDDRNKLKGLVTMENGVNALVTALGEARVKDPAFVRYHGSKLTVLLQDTVKASAKFLVIIALPATVSSVEETKVSTVIRTIQQLRSAVFVSTVSPWGKVATRDRSLEGFMNRFAQQQQQSQDGGSSAEAYHTSSSLPFSSSELQDRSRHGFDESDVRWEKELDSMSKRYGADVDIFATSFFQPPTYASTGTTERGPVLHDESSNRLQAPYHVKNLDASDDEFTGTLQHSPSSRNKGSRVHPHAPQEYQELHPPPAPLSSSSMNRRVRRAQHGLQLFIHELPRTRRKEATGTSSRIALGDARDLDSHANDVLGARRGQAESFERGADTRADKSDDSVAHDAQDPTRDGFERAQKVAAGSARELAVCTPAEEKDSVQVAALTHCIINTM